MLPIPQPFGGVIVIDYNTLCYVNGVVRKDLEMSPCAVLATAKVDPNGSRWLLGDRSGAHARAVVCHVCVVVWPMNG